MGMEHDGPAAFALGLARPWEVRCLIQWLSRIIPDGR